MIVAVSASEPGAHSRRHLLECHEFRSAFNLDAGCSEAIDQQPFMLVLRVDQRIRKRTQIFAHIPEDHVRDTLTGLPEIDTGHFPAAGDDRVCQAKLAIQLERACLDRERARRRARLRGLVDDPDADSQASQPQRQHQARRPCSDDENVCALCQRPTMVQNCIQSSDD